MRFSKIAPAGDAGRKYCVPVLFVLIVFTFFLLSLQINIATPNVVPLKSCYYRREPDDFRDAGKLNFNTSETDLIFFLETSCRSTSRAVDRVLTPRQACAVESAALLNPNHTVNVLFASPVSQTRDVAFNKLSKYPNIQFFRINFDSYLSDTPLDSWLSSGKLNTSKYPIEHTSDVLRLLTLWKFGGIYLDLDVVVVKPLGTLEMNWVGREKSGAPANGVISFTRDEQGRKFTEAALREISTNFKGNDWTHNGPKLISRVLKQLCSDKKMPGDTSEDRCNGFRMFGPDYFYPIPHNEWNLYFEPQGMKRIMKTENVTYLYHVWNKKSSTRKTNASSTVPYTYLARKHCPKVYAVTKDYF